MSRIVNQSLYLKQKMHCKLYRRALMYSYHTCISLYKKISDQKRQLPRIGQAINIPFFNDIRFCFNWFRLLLQSVSPLFQSVSSPCQTTSSPFHHASPGSDQGKTSIKHLFFYSLILSFFSQLNHT